MRILSGSKVINCYDVVQSLFWLNLLVYTLRQWVWQLFGMVLFEVVVVF